MTLLPPSAACGLAAELPTVALSLRQPWASLLVAGVKLWETRSWRTAFRGRFAVHAGKWWTPAIRELCRQEPFASALAALGYPDPDQLPRGCFLGAVTLTDCVEMVEHGVFLAHQPGAQATGSPDRLRITDDQLPWGDFRPGRFAYLVADPWQLPTPIPSTGRLGFYKLTAADILLPSPLEGEGSGVRGSAACGLATADGR